MGPADRSAGRRQLPGRTTRSSRPGPASPRSTSRTTTTARASSTPTKATSTSGSARRCGPTAPTSRLADDLVIAVVGSTAIIRGVVDDVDDRDTIVAVVERVPGIDDVLRRDESVRGSDAGSGRAASGPRSSAAAVGSVLGGVEPGDVGLGAEPRPLALGERDVALGVELDRRVARQLAVEDRPGLAVADRREGRQRRDRTARAGRAPPRSGRRRTGRGRGSRSARRARAGRRSARARRSGPGSRAAAAAGRRHAARRSRGRGRRGAGCAGRRRPRVPARAPRAASTEAQQAVGDRARPRAGRGRPGRSAGRRCRGRARRRAGRGPVPPARIATPPSRGQVGQDAAGVRGEVGDAERLVRVDEVEAVVRDARPVRRRRPWPCRCRGRGRPGASRPR